jgi:phage terminase large subunit-like protein
VAPSLGARGTARIVAGEREVEILFTNRALAEAEAAVGRSIVAILEGFQDGTCGITEAAKLLRVGMEAARRDSRAGGRVMTENDAYEVLDALGYARTLATVMEAVAYVLGYDAEGQGEESDPNA